MKLLVTSKHNASNEYIYFTGKVQSYVINPAPSPVYWHYDLEGVVSFLPQLALKKPSDQLKEKQKLKKNKKKEKKKESQQKQIITRTTKNP